MWVWVIVSIVGVIALISALQYNAQRGTYRPLAGRRPGRRAQDTRPLGTEALDLEEVRRTQRRNESLERAHTNWNRSGHSFSALQAAETDVAPMPEDETYAKRFHTAFIKDKD